MIAFHSLEDGLVKNRFRDLAKESGYPPDIARQDGPAAADACKLLTRKPIEPADAEVAAIRARARPSCAAAEKLLTVRVSCASVADVADRAGDGGGDLRGAGARLGAAADAVDRLRHLARDQVAARPRRAESAADAGAAHAHGSGGRRADRARASSRWCRPIRGSIRVVNAELTTTRETTGDRADADAGPRRRGRAVRAVALGQMRLYFCAGLVACGFGGLCWRAYVLQVRESERLKAMAEDQYLKDVELPPKRGRILDRNGVELAASAEVDSVHVNARMLIAGDRVAETARALAEALHIDRRELEQEAARRGATSRGSSGASPPDEARAVRELALPGVYLDRRAAPLLSEPRAGRAAARLGRARRRRAGGHRAAVRALAARRAGAAAGAARRARARGAHRRARRRRPTSPATICTRRSIATSSSGSSSALEKGVAAHHAKAGVAVALDPNNGEILAMAAVPSLNPNEPDGAREHGRAQPRGDRSVRAGLDDEDVLDRRRARGRRHQASTRTGSARTATISVGGRTIHDAEPIGDVTTDGRAGQVVEHLHGQDRRARRARAAARDAAALRLRAADRRRSAGRARRADPLGRAHGAGRDGDDVVRAGADGDAAAGGGGATRRSPTAACCYKPHVMRRVVGARRADAAEAQVEGSA